MPCGGDLQLRTYLSVPVSPTACLLTVPAGMGGGFRDAHCKPELDIPSMFCTYPSVFPLVLYTHGPWDGRQSHPAMRGFCRHHACSTGVCVECGKGCADTQKSLDMYYGICYEAKGVHLLMCAFICSCICGD